MKPEFWQHVHELARQSVLPLYESLKPPTDVSLLPVKSYSDVRIPRMQFQDYGGKLPDGVTPHDEILVRTIFHNGTVDHAIVYWKSPGKPDEVLMTQFYTTEDLRR